MRALAQEVRLWVAEKLLHWVLVVCPDGRDESAEIAAMIRQYMKRRVFLREGP